MPPLSSEISAGSLSPPPQLPCPFTFLGSYNAYLERMTGEGFIPHSHFSLPEFSPSPFFPRTLLIEAGTTEVLTKGTVAMVGPGVAILVSMVLVRNSRPLHLAVEELYFLIFCTLFSFPLFYCFKMWFSIKVHFGYFVLVSCVQHGGPTRKAGSEVHLFLDKRAGPRVQSHKFLTKTCRTHLGNLVNSNCCSCNAARVYPTRSEVGRW